MNILQTKHLDPREMKTAAAECVPHDISLVHSTREPAAAHLLLVNVRASVEPDEE
jgi:hypothetical protein